MRALWIEDHQLIGDSLEVFLQVKIPALSLDKARTVEAAVQLVQAFPYEVILMDWWMGQSDGNKTLRAIQAVGCRAPVIVVTGDDRPEVARQVAAWHVAASVSKAADPQELIDTIERVLRGEHVAARAAPSLKDPVRQPPYPTVPLDVQDIFPELTPRQAEVFRGLMRGLSDKEIARELAISDTTARTHVRTILQIVGAHKRGEAVYIARQRGAHVA